MASQESHESGAPRLTGGPLNAALTRAVVKVHSDHLGRGPVKAHTFFRADTVVVVLDDVLTRAEQSLVQEGRADIVLDLRRKFQSTMAPDLVAAVEDLTGRTVAAFMSDNHIEPDLGCEIFVLGEQIPAV